MVSSSNQVAYSGLSGVPSNIVSSSTQATSWTVATASLANAVTFANVTNKPVLFSSSLQIPSVSTASYYQQPSTINVTIGTTTGYQGCFEIPAQLTVQKIRMRGVTSGSISVDIRQMSPTNWSTLANAGTSITGALQPSMSNNQTYSDDVASGWAQLVGGNVCNVWVNASSGSAAFNAVTLALYTVRT